MRIIYGGKGITPNASIMILKPIDLTKFSAGNFQKDAIELMNNIVESSVNGVNVKELLRYNKTSLWWFFHPVVYPVVERYMRFIAQFQTMLEELKPTVIEVQTDFDKLYLIEQICLNNGVKVEYNRMKFGFYAIISKIKDKIRYYRLNKITDKKQKERIRLALETKHKYTIERQSVIFAVPSAHRRFIYSIDEAKSIKREYVLQPIIDFIKQHGFPITLIDLDYSLKGDFNTLKERLNENGFNCLPVEIFFTKEAVSRCKQDLIRLKKLLRALLNDDDFHYKFKYKGINFWKSIRQTFATLECKPYLFSFIVSIESILDILAKVSPRAIIMSYEAGPYAKAFIVSAKDLGIRTIALQHGIIFDGVADYMHRDIGNTDLSYPVPDITLVYGEYARKILTEKGSYPSNKVMVFGNPLYYNIEQIKKHMNKEQILRTYGLGSTKKIVMIATGRYQEKYGWQNQDPIIIKMLLDKFANNDNCLFIIKPHPGEDSTIYESMIAETKARNFKIITEGLYELLHICDLLVTIRSGIIIDALAFGKHVAIVDIFNDPNVSEYAKYGVALLVRPELLTQVVFNIIEGKLSMPNFLRNREAFLRLFYNIHDINLNRILDIISIQN